jgi:hypothetical protein
VGSPSSMSRRRIELELRMLRASLRHERRYGDPEALASFAERSDPILERLALRIDAEADPELLKMLAGVRAEMDGARSS